VEVTHDRARLGAGPPLVAITEALQLDRDGQVVATAGGIGGSAAGLSVVAAPTTRDRRSTLVDRLAAPATLPAHEVDVVVTERGAADLRGQGRAERRRAIEALWE
jgi:acyl-CoA hydrolase